MCCARGSTSTGCSQSGEAWNVKETGREAALPHRHFRTFSLLRSSALGLGKREPRCSLASGLKAEIAQPLPTFVITVGPWQRCGEAAAAQWHSAFCSAGKEGNTTERTVPCAGIRWLCRAARSVIAEASLRGWEAEDGGHTYTTVGLRN